MSGLAFTHALGLVGRAARVLGLALPVLLTACAVAPDPNYQPPPPAMITINTIPAGADISIQGNYVGVSPLSVPAPPGYRSAEAWRIDQALIHAMGVLPDFRKPDNIRLGITPLYTSFADIYQAVMRIKQVVTEQLYLHYSQANNKVT